VRAREARRIDIPADGAPDAADAIGDDGFAVARSAEHDPALVVPDGHGFRDRPDEQGIVHGLSRIRSEIVDVVPRFAKPADDEPFVSKAGVVRTDRDFHGCRLTPRVRRTGLRTARSTD
jgi:hypothetical protein